MGLPKDSEFWKNIKKEIDKILELEILLDPVVCVLGALPREIYNEEKRYVLRILLLIAKKNDNSTLEGEGSPSLVQWTQRLKQVYIMEKMTACLQMKMDIFLQRWKSITNYLDM